VTPTNENMRQTGIMASNTIALLAGVWLFVSPWVYSASMERNAWNSWIFGAVIAILAAIRLGRPMGTVALSWIHCLLGIWMFISPWVYGYATDMGRFVNSLCIGVVVFVAAISIAASSPHTQHPVPTHN